MSSMPWLRLYSETLHDRKIAKIARQTKHPKSFIVGVWVSLLMMANDSPIRGELYIGEDMPADWDDILYELDLSDEEYRPIHYAFLNSGMLEKEPHPDRWVIVNWDKRQFKSDNSTARVRKWRKEQAKKEDENDETLHVTEDETFLKRSSNVIDTDTDTDTDENIHTRAHPDPEPIAEIKAALGQVTKTPQLLNEDAYDKAAYQLVGWDATPDQISGFSQWWERNSYYNGKPALKSLVNEWQNYIGGVERDRASPNQPTGNEVDTSEIVVNEDGSY